MVRLLQLKEMMCRAPHYGLLNKPRNRNSAADATARIEDLPSQNAIFCQTTEKYYDVSFHTHERREFIPFFLFETLRAQTPTFPDFLAISYQETSIES